MQITGKINTIEVDGEITSKVLTMLFGNLKYFIIFAVAYVLYNKLI